MAYDPYKYLTMRDKVRAFCVIYGNPTEGLKVVGPWTNPESVKDWAERAGLKEGQYWLSYLQHPMD